MSSRLTALMMLVAVAVMLAGCGREAERPGDSASEKPGVLVVDRRDERDQRYIEGSRILMSIDGDELWGEPRIQDGTVRSELKPGQYAVTAYQFICSSACPDEQALRTMIAKHANRGGLVSCSTKVNVETGAPRFLRAVINSGADGCTWDQIKPRDNLAPPDHQPTVRGGGPAPAWVDSSHGSVWMQGGSYCWGFPSGMGCADSIGPNCTGIGALRTPVLDVEPGEAITVHLGVSPRTASITMQPLIVGRDLVEVTDIQRSDRGRELRFSAPDAGVTLTISIRAPRGDAAWHACLRVVDDTSTNDTPTKTTEPSKDLVTSEARAVRMFDGEHRGGGLVPIPGTVECEKRDRPDLSDGPAWKCTALLGEPNKDKVTRATGYVLRTDGGIAERSQDIVDAPAGLPDLDRTVATLESSTGAIDMQTAPRCGSGCTAVRPTVTCDGPSAPPTLRVYEGETFSARVPRGTSSAAMILDDDPMSGATPRPAQPHLDGRILTTTLLKPRLRFVTVTATTARGTSYWFACLDPT